MDRLVTSLVFCDAPVDFAYGGTSVGTGAKLARAGGDVSSEAAAGKMCNVSASSARGRQAECAPALDGLDCFETVVMPTQ